MSRKLPFTRRAFFRGVGGLSVWLPYEFYWKNGSIAYAEQGIPNRLVTFYFPNGCQPDLWNYQNAVSPLLPMKNYICLMQGIQNSVSTAFKRDAHEQGGATLFTGVPLRNDRESTGISLDQFAAKHLNKSAILKEPLVMGVWRGFAGGQYRSISWSRRSWRENGLPVEPLQNPKKIFEQLFNAPRISPEVIDKLNIKKSILDSVVNQYKSTISDRYPLSKENKEKLKVHLEKIRQIEVEMIKVQDSISEQCLAYQPPQAISQINGLLPYSSFEAAFRGQIDLLVMALQCGFTNTGSLMFGCAGEEYVHPAVSPSLADHRLSHYRNENEKNLFIKYRQYHMSNLLLLLQKMHSVREANGKSLLENSIVLAGTEFGESRNHTRSPQPHLVAGGAGLKMNQIVDVASKHTANDLYTTILKGVGIQVPNFGLADHNKGIIAQLVP